MALEYMYELPEKQSSITPSGQAYYNQVRSIL